jgi:hypothetical protein
MPRRLLSIGAGAYASGSGTSNVVPKGNGAGQFSDSSITDNGTVVSFTEPIRVADGAAATPSYSFTSGTNFGFRWLTGTGVAVGVGNGTDLFSFGTTNGLSIAAVAGLRFTSGLASNGDVILTRSAAAALQLGAVDAAAPVAQTLQVQSATATNTDQAGGDWTLINSKGTGIGALPRTIIKGPLLGSTGTTVQTAAIREVLCYNKTGLTNNTATSLVTLALPSGSHGTCQFVYSVEVNDATDFQTETGMVSFASTNKAGVLVHGTPAKSGNVQSLSSAAPLAVTFTAVTNGSAVDLKITSNSSLTPTSTRVMLQILNPSFKNDITLL